MSGMEIGNVFGQKEMENHFGHILYTQHGEKVVENYDIEIL